MERRILDICAAIGKKYQLDPMLLAAIVEQESSEDNSEARLENKYYRKYVRPMDLATSSEVLLAASYGLMQMMGLSLKEIGYFDDYAAKNGNVYPPLSQMNVCKGVDDFMIDETAQIEYGAKWFRSKLKKAAGNVPAALGYWNGDKTGKYSGEVLARYERLKKQK